MLEEFDGVKFPRWSYTDRHREDFQEVRCRVVTSRGSGSGTHVRILEVEEARRWKLKKWFWNYYCRNQGGMCYRHNLAGLEGGPRARWAQRIIVIGLRIGSCAGGLRPDWPCI
jgi:hypothetical protein